MVAVVCLRTARARLARSLASMKAYGSIIWAVRTVVSKRRANALGGGISRKPKGEGGRGRREGKRSAQHDPSPFRGKAVHSLPGFLGDWATASLYETAGASRPLKVQHDAGRPCRRTSTASVSSSRPRDRWLSAMQRRATVASASSRRCRPSAARSSSGCRSALCRALPSEAASVSQSHCRSLARLLRLSLSSSLAFHRAPALTPRLRLPGAPG